MIVYTNPKFKTKKKHKVRGTIAKKYDARKYMDVRSVYAASDRRPLRPGSEVASTLPSLQHTSCWTSRSSVMDPMSLAKETPEIQDAIIAKSKRIAIAYNKGAYQYVTDGTDPKTLGSGERLRRS
jgi:hypothetical protein